MIIEIALGIIAVPFVLAAIVYAVGFALAAIVWALLFTPAIAVTALMAVNDLQTTNYPLFVTVMLVSGAINALGVFWGTQEDTERLKRP